MLYVALRDGFEWLISIQRYAPANSASCGLEKDVSQLVALRVRKDMLPQIKVSKVCCDGEAAAA
jgi:hypothetical protein